MDRSKCSLGVTLIEFLIVVAVVGVLLAVIVPNVYRFFGPEETVTAIVVEDELLVVHYGRMEFNKPYSFDYLGTSMVAVRSGSGFVDIYTSDRYYGEHL